MAGACCRTTMVFVDGAEDLARTVELRVRSWRRTTPSRSADGYVTGVQSPRCRVPASAKVSAPPGVMWLDVTHRPDILSLLRAKPCMRVHMRRVSLRDACGGIVRIKTVRVNDRQIEQPDRPGYEARVIDLSCTDHVAVTRTAYATVALSTVFDAAGTGDGGRLAHDAATAVR